MNPRCPLCGEYHVGGTYLYEGVEVIACPKCPENKIIGYKMSTKINTKVNILNFGEQMPDGSYRFRGYQLDELFLDIQKEAAEKAWIKCSYDWFSNESSGTHKEWEDALPDIIKDFEEYWQSQQSAEKKDLNNDKE